MPLLKEANAMVAICARDIIALRPEWKGYLVFMRYRISRLPSDSRTILYPHTRRNWA